MAAAQSAAGPSTSRNDPEDLYSDLYPSDDDLDKTSEANELYDAVLTGTVDKDKKASSKVVSRKNASEEGTTAEEQTQKEGKRARRLSIYVGNFPWWTSDKDLTSLAQKLGVRDIADIIFAENKLNGQSRGYAELVVTSEKSLKILLEKMPQCHINGEKINCRFATRQNLSVFEDIANKRIPLRVGSGSKDSDSMEKTPTTLPSRESSALPAPPPLFPSNPFANMFPSPPSPFLGRPPPLFPHMPPPVPPLMPPHMFPPQIPGLPPPGLHLNPPFFNLTQDGASSKSHKDRGEDGDHEELMNRNRAIASSAITKAISGATTGDLGTAMETLLTAIAIIKQSRVYEDECCQALVTSLKDCLVSIQGDYSSKQSRHSRERDRDRGRERDHERDRERDRDRDRERYRERDRDGAYDRESAGASRRYRERSWSEERDRERSRERHRDHRDRYR
uniref:Cleavage and polyadenylation specificity factor subunit 6 n=1 Tax=Fundulus heteroclitus TaxID=8078 RepID=A0A146YP52_FUNHE